EIYFMNKYSSKAVKTAATVGMSLAMVLSNAAPVFAAASKPTATVCIAQDAIYGKKVIDAIKKDLKAQNLTLNTAKLNTTLGKTGETAKYLVANALDTAKTIEEILDIKTSADYGNETVSTLLASVVLCGDDEDQAVKDAKHLIGNSDDWTTFEVAVKNAIDQFIELSKSTYLNDDMITDGEYDGAKALYSELDAAKDYIKNIDPADTTTKNSGSGAGATAIAAYENLWDDFVDAIEDYEKSTIGTFVKAYVNALEDQEIEGVNVYDLVNRDVDFPRENLTALENFIKDVKNDKIADLKNEAKYNTVKDEEEVIEYIEGLETIVEEIKEANTLLKTSNSAYKDFKEVLTKVEDLAEKVDTLKGIKEGAVGYDDADLAVEKELNKFTAADVEKLQTYVEDVVNQFVTVKAVKRTTGNYTLSFENADYGRYLNDDDSFNEDLEYLMLTTVTKDEETSYYDLVLDNEGTSKAKLIKAVTTDIEGITLSSTLTTAQASKIVAAKKAYDELMGENSLYTLTLKEKKAVKANEELIKTLYFKLIMNGSVTQSGWVDKGNGNWDYIAEDGTRPSKWIASGANWYYVKNGTMLRNSWIASDAQGTRWYYVDDNGVMVSNTTVNGYTFNSYGVWVK
ncbi:hypothetical protein DES51_1381, partial [Dielma fastidiosa]